VAVFGLTAVLFVPPAAAADPEEAQYNVVVTLYNAGQWEAALKKIQEREGRDLADPMRIKYMYARGLALEKGGKGDDAARAYAALIGKYPEAAESQKARVALVFMRYAARDYDGVLAAVGQIKQDGLAPAEKQQIAVMTGEAWSAKDDRKKAIEFYNQALKLGADRESIVPKLFGAYYQLGMHKELLDVSSRGIAGVAPDTLAAIRAESMLETGQFPQAEAEARKVPAGSENHPRASFALAQALIKQRKLADAVAPLQLAIEKLQKPPMPASAHLALADCLLAAGKTDEAGAAVRAALSRAASLTDAEANDLRSQAALLNVRIASRSGDNRKLADAVAEARASIPAEQLPELLYARIYALQEAGDDAAILRGMKDDSPVFQGKPQEGRAALLYAGALKRGGKADQARTLLEGYVQGKPDTVEGLRARVELANMALTAEDYPRAAAQISAVLGARDAAAKLGAVTFAECRFNGALAALKTGDAAGSIKTAEALLKDKPPPELTAAACLLLGQAYSHTGDHRNAAHAWKQALAVGKGVDETDVRDRIGRSLLAAGDAAGARAEYEALAAKLGGADRMPREARETQARALYAAGDFAAAAAAYELLYAGFKNAPVYAYECAVCMDKAGKWADAEKWYAAAEKGVKDLPADYARSLTDNINRVRFQAGTGDMGLAYWLDRLASGRSDAEFDSAVAALCRTADAVKPDGAVFARMETAQGAYNPDSARYYGVGAARLHFMAAAGDFTSLRNLSGRLADDFAAREKALAARSWSTTVAQAMICFYRGEGERRAGNHADALAAYETVLAAYPYNEWPDAAACGAAECYAALGDAQTAIAKLNEVVKNAGAAGGAGSKKWVELARKRMAELTGGK
jgi:tetratricopeptide (TPR) repeat protein